MRYCLGWTCNNLPTNRSSVMYSTAARESLHRLVSVHIPKHEGDPNFCQHEEEHLSSSNTHLGLGKKRIGMGVSPTALWRRLARGRGEVCSSQFKRGAVELTDVLCRPGSTGTAGRFKRLPMMGQLRNHWWSCQLAAQNRVHTCLGSRRFQRLRGERTKWRREIFAQEQECETPEWARDNLASRAATFGSRATSAPLIRR